jgi:hypothetical protein
VTHEAELAIGLLLPVGVTLNTVEDGRESALAQEKAPTPFALSVAGCPRRLSYLLFAALAIKGTTNPEMNLVGTKAAIGSEWTWADPGGAAGTFSQPPPKP